MAPIVEVVLRRHGGPDGDRYEAASVAGRVCFGRRDEGAGWAFDHEVVEGANPLADQSTDRFAPLADEVANRFPDRSVNAYPHAYEQVAQLFDSPRAPDLIAIHTSAHNWEDEGGHRGEHGSIDVVQARAPFILAGAGVARRGVVDESCLLVDVAPTVLALLGVEPGPGVGLNGRPRDDAFLARQDGEAQLGLLGDRGDRPDHVVGFLFDGANANVLYDAAARGEAPNVTRLMAMGSTLGHGAISSLPTITLANHTAIVTGAHPGHHGILNNAWWDRASGEQVITNSPSTWATSMATLNPGIESMHDVVHRAFPGSFTASVNEPCDVGADYSTFGVMRAGGTIDRPPPVDELPNTSQMFVRPVKEYKWSTLVDHTSVTQFVDVWSGHAGNPRPRFTWVNFALTDAAFHEGGPYSEIAAASIRDTDARLGAVLDTVERSGAFDRTAFFLVADHGMEETNPDVRGNWSSALDDSGVAYRDEAYGFIYVNP
ncbi:MAG: alkaline phosphatase family protein, partial [Acidimicrobiales bacterium]